MNTKEFNALKKRQLLYGFKACNENANSHFQTAIMCADKNYFGIANSHLILAVEEAIKAQHFLMKYFSPNEYLNVDGLFHSHKTKHNNGFAIFKDVKKMSERITKEMSKIALKKIEEKEIKNQKTIDEIKQKFEEVNKFQKSFKNIKIKKWWEKANDQKNNGFYVDRIKKWSTPKLEISKNDYLKSYAIVGHFLLLNEMIKISLNSS